MSATPSNGAIASRRSALPPPHNLHAISEDLTEAQRKQAALEERDRQREIREAVMASRFEAIMSDSKWIKRLVVGALVAEGLRVVLQHFAPLAHVIS